MQLRLILRSFSIARTYLQTPLQLPEIFPIGQWNRFKLTEVRHLLLALKLVRSGTKVFLMGSLMGFVMGSVMLYFLITQPCIL